ncbi:MAG: tyrosine-type recombinase/integrase [Umezawaea sp.]
MATKALVEWDLGHKLHRVWRGLVRDWRAELKSAGKSAATLRIYTTAVHHLVAYLISIDELCEPEEVTKSHIRGLFAYLIDTRSKGTANTSYRALRPFSKFLKSEDEITKSPMEGTTQPKLDPDAKPTPVVSDLDTNKLLKACSGRTVLDLRDKAIILFLWDTGVRRAEIAGLAVEDINLELNVAMVTGKGGKSRIVRFGAKTAKALARYLRVRSKLVLAHLRALWLGVTGRGPLKAISILHMIKRRAVQAGISTDIWVHMLRHTFAHNYRMAGGNDSDLMVLGGWSTIKQLERYGKSAASMRAIEAHSRLSLSDRLSV